MSVSDARLELEFGYTTHFSCKDIYDGRTWCRRPTGHADEHAAGFGSGRVRWPRSIPTEVFKPA